MTPQQKAEELVGKYMFLLNVDLPITKAKYSAIITVDEAKKCTKYENQKFENDRFSEDYWEQVKTEINNL
jgi:hypothetical protein